MQLLGWRRVASLTEEGQKYSEYIPHLEQTLQENNVQLIANAKFPKEREHSAMTRVSDKNPYPIGNLLLTCLFCSIY